MIVSLSQTPGSGASRCHTSGLFIQLIFLRSEIAIYNIFSNLVGMV